MLSISKINGRDQRLHILRMAKVRYIQKKAEVS